MTPHVFVIPMLGLFALSACFMSAEPHVKAGTLFARGPVAFCTPDDPPCKTGYPSGDGYVVESDEADEEDLRLRFESLTEAGGVPIYIGEAELRADDETAWAYIVARPTNATVDGAPRYEIAMPACGDLDTTQDARFGIIRTDAYSCSVTDFAAFREYLIETHAAKFADPAWWADED